jgi:hypothetical protein
MPLYKNVTKHLSPVFESERDTSQSQSLLSPVPICASASPETETLGHVDRMETQELAGILQITPENSEDAVHPCSFKSCKFRRSSAQMRQCASFKFGCEKYVHSYCFGNFLAKNDLDALIDPEDETTYCVCSKRCYNKVKNGLANNTYYAPGDTTRLGWDKDGRNGPQDINNSLKLLFDWMGENGAINYTRFRGKDNHLSKQNIAEMVARRINSYGVKVKRSAKSILNKLYTIEKSFRSAHDFANSETGAGLLATDNVTTFEKLIEKRCMNYDELLPIFQGRASARAKITNSNLDEPDDDSTDEEDEPSTTGNDFQEKNYRKTTVLWQLQCYWLTFVEKIMNWYQSMVIRVTKKTIFLVQLIARIILLTNNPQCRTMTTPKKTFYYTSYFNQYRYYL